VDGDDESRRIPSQWERICAECGKEFAINSQWIYRLIINGRTLWYCRYNCMRAAERKHKKSKGRKERMQSKKPPKERLEEHLKAGALIVDIARRYEASAQSVKNWIKDYGLQDVKPDPRPKSEVVCEESSIDCGVDQDLPTSTETERLQAIPAQDSIGESPDKNLCDEESIQATEITRVDLIETVRADSDGPDARTPDLSENFDEIWRDVRDDLVTLDRLYVAGAKKSFRERLQEMLAEVMGHE